MDRGNVMQYYKYKSINNADKKLMSLRINKYKSKEKRNYKINKFLSKFVFCWFFALCIGLGVTLKFLRGMIINEIFTVIFIVLSLMLYLPITICLSFIPYHYISKLFQYGELPKVINEMIVETTTPIRKYYKLTNNYLVTKCFYTSKEEITNKDVILFVYDNKLRITNDFYHSIKDFGCYEFSFDEIKVYNKVNGNFVYSVIEADNIVFHLGKTARNFIFKNFDNKR